MGYTTDFSGEFAVTPNLKPEHVAFLQSFNRTRRVARDETIAATLPDPVREAVGLPVGFEGSYFVGETEFVSVIDGNEAPGQARSGWAINLRSLTASELEAGKGDFKLRHYRKIGDPCQLPGPHDFARKAADQPMHGCHQAIVSLGDPEKAQPGLWCQWTVWDDGSMLEWDGGEKFYDYVEWLVYLLKHFLVPWGYTLNGSVEWMGESADDRGLISVNLNVVSVQAMRFEYDEPVEVFRS